MFIVNRCVKDYGEVFKTEVATFATESEAVEFAGAEDRSAPFLDVWHEVEMEEV